MSEYFIDLDGKTVGPLTLEEITDLYRSGVINDQTIYTILGADHWGPVAYLRLKPSPPPSPKQSLSAAHWAAIILGGLLAMVIVINGWLWLHQSEILRTPEEEMLRIHIAELAMAARAHDYDGVQSACVAAITVWEANQDSLATYRESLEGLRKETQYVCHQADYSNRAVDFQTLADLCQKALESRSAGQ